MGDGDSSDGSESAPSDDNLPQKELLKNLPVDKDLPKKDTKKKVIPKEIIKRAPTPKDPVSPKKRPVRVVLTETNQE